MAVDGSSRQRARVLIAGGGFAAVEAVLALRALVGDRARPTLLAADPIFRYRPAATLEAFDETPPRRYDLRAIAADAGAAYRNDRLESVDSVEHCVRTASGARIEYDALVLGTGARAVSGIPGALLFRGQRDAHLMRGLLAELEAGRVRSVAFAVPSGCSWPLPLYELALLCARQAHRRGLDVELSLVTPERAPLEVFGPQASRLVGELLADREVRFLGATAATEVRRDGSLALAFSGTLEVDRVVAVPELVGRRITGVPASWWGFVPVDSLGRVDGLSDVYAAGDMTTFPIKQGGLATQQADRIAETIADSLGVSVKQLRATNVLSVRLLGGDRPTFLRTELDWLGQPTAAALEHAEHNGTTAWTKVFGRYLTPYLEKAQPLAA